MTVLALIAAISMAAAAGYYLGRRAGSAPRSRRMSTSRIAVGKLAVNLLVLLAARRVRRTFRPEPMLFDALPLWRLRRIAPVDLLRGSVTRTR